MNNYVVGIFDLDSREASEIIGGDQKGIFIIFKSESDSAELTDFLDMTEYLLQQSGWETSTFNIDGKTIKNGKPEPAFTTSLQVCLKGRERKGGAKVLALSAQAGIRQILDQKLFFDAVLVVNFEGAGIAENELPDSDCSAAGGEPRPVLIVSVGKSSHAEGGRIFNGLREAGYDVFMYRYNFNLLSINEITLDFLSEFNDWVEYV